MSVLLVYPTHENCREVQAAFTAAGCDAACYPRRVFAAGETEFPNCWNREADEAERMGFAVVKAVCSACRERTRCLASGYLAELTVVKDAEVVLCTHKRAEYTGLKELMHERSYVSIHEDAVDTLRPPVAITEPDLLLAKHVLQRLLNDPHMLDWFADATKIDDNGRRFHDNEMAVRKQRQYEFAHLLFDLVERLLADVQRTDATVAWQSASTAKVPQGMERTLFFAAKVSRVTFDGQPWRFLLAAAAGDLYSAAIIVDRRFRKHGGLGNAFASKLICGFRNNLPTFRATVWFNDATMSPVRLAAILGRAVRNETPPGRLELQRKAVQIPRDVTRRTSPRILSNILRGLLADRRQFQRVGIICHSVHVDAIERLDWEYRKRIQRISYFGSGDDRSSNAWHEACDLIVVAGTPRVAPAVVASYLVQIGEVAAACQPPEWGSVNWHGQTEAGESVTVQGRGYLNAVWREAHRDIVRSALVQAVGRGRGILPSGCEVILLSTEECGLLLSDSKLEPLNDLSHRAWLTLNELTMENANKRPLGKSIVNTKSIAESLGVSEVRAREILRHLERRGLAQKIGERSGWRAVNPVNSEGCEASTVRSFAEP